MIDLRGNIPLVVHIDDGKSYDTDILDVIVPEPGAVYVMDRGYIDLVRLHRLTAPAPSSSFAPRASRACVASHRGPSTAPTGLVCDQIVRLAWRARPEYPDRLRRVRYPDPKTGKTLVFLTNNFTLPARIVADLYRCRWQIELFFKWIKQHLRIKSFFGTLGERREDPDLDRGRVYVLIAIVKKRLRLSASLYTILHCSASPRSRKSR